MTEPSHGLTMVRYAGWIYLDSDYADEFNDGYAWDAADFTEFLLDTLGDTVPLWRSTGPGTEVAARDVTEVIAEQCDTHQTGLLMLGTGNAGLLLLGTYGGAGYCTAEAQALADVLGVPLISRQGCS